MNGTTLDVPAEYKLVSLLSLINTLFRGDGFQLTLQAHYESVTIVCAQEQVMLEYLERIVDERFCFSILSRTSAAARIDPRCEMRCCLDTSNMGVETVTSGLARVGPTILKIIAYVNTTQSRKPTETNCHTPRLVATLRAATQFKRNSATTRPDTKAPPDGHFDL